MATKLELPPNTNDRSRSCCIVLLVGLPGAGKTTFAKILSQTNEAASCATVSFDEVLPLEEQKALSTAPSSSDNKWKLARQDMKDRVRKEMTERNDNVIVFVDDNNYYRSMRHEYYQLARELQVGFCQFYLKVSDITTALESNAQRPDHTRVPDDVVRNMAERIEPPDPLANSWESFSFDIDVDSWRKDSEQFLPTVKSVIEAAAASPVAPLVDAEPARRESRLANDKSLMHRVDKRLRKIVGDRIAQALSDETDGEAVEATGLKMVKVRTELLKDLKSGDNPDYCLPDELVKQIKDSATTNSCDAEIDEALNKMFDLKLRPNDG